LVRKPLIERRFYLMAKAAKPEPKPDETGTLGQSELPPNWNRLSPQQRKFLAFYLSLGSAIQAYQLAGYAADPNASPNNVYAAASQVLRGIDMQAAISHVLKQRGLTPEACDVYLHEMLNATETKFFAHEGRVLDEREVIAWGPRATALDMLHKRHGLYKTQVPALPEGSRGALIYLPDAGQLKLPTQALGTGEPVRTFDGQGQVQPSGNGHSDGEAGSGSGASPG
jgi:hypothetical protein